MSKKLKLIKKKQPPQKSFTYPENYPVIIGVPVPMIDHKVMIGLSHFITGTSARKVALPLTVDSRNSENGRNRIIKDFLTMPEYKDKTHLFFIDADTVPDDVHALEKMLMLDKPVVSGITPIAHKHGKELSLYWNVRREKDKRNLYLDEMPSTPFVADYVGGSCMLIRRDVLEKLEVPYQMATYCDEQINFKIGEDYYFCDKIRNAGFELWVQPQIMCHHYHTMDMLDIIFMLARYAKSMTDEGVIKSYEGKIKDLLDEIERLKKAC